MAQLHFARGATRVSFDNQADTTMPIFLDDHHRVIEAPSWWISKIAHKASRSNDTLHKYANIMLRYLQWLDDNGYGANGWAMVDEKIFESFVDSLCGPDVTGQSIVYYCARIKSFYKWAQSSGYRHFFDLSSNIEEKVEVAMRHQLMLAHVKSTVTVTKVGIDSPTGKPALHEREVEKFVTERNHRIALSFMDDIAFQMIATIIWTTGLRPRDLWQLPYRGNKENSEFVPYDVDVIPAGIEAVNMNFWFRSKGKHRSIEFPGAIWKVICERYIPLRRERATLYMEKYGISPPNSALFLTVDGEIINSDKLLYEFSKVVAKCRSTIEGGADSGFSGRKYNARMLRHSCATYFVYEHLKQKGLIGKPYVYDPSVDEKLRRMLGHESVETTYKYYVHLVNRFHSDDLLKDLKKSHVNVALNALLDSLSY